MAIRGGKRELIHKGPLRVLAVGKEGGVRLAYFYVFNDVVSTSALSMYSRLLLRRKSCTDRYCIPICQSALWSRW